ncbi:glycoside hydrolase family 5 protein [Sphaerobolus stellatus SS14]|uniref:glucan 1,3-beta-glucosidase n=1 Tax=Sphaerobolus stellatus (strain SS14) TaxID=990650 RepID=A0A0C9TSZ8_SPHS4|nr:glycoside hydrolase family 5 protein [Sphaerobolus stellatus SS14]
MGGDGSTVVTENGTQFTYTNRFGGFWVQDPSNPYTYAAQPNSWTPPLNTSWRFGIDKIYGVNLGGLFVMEPFITPDIFQRYPTAVDEWTLSTAMRNDTANGGIAQLEAHYATFISEQDIAEIAGAGLNWIRVPLPFWAIETYPEEPFLAKTSWNYFLRILSWARKYGLRVCLDLHTIPGSQNGFDHSGRLSPINFLSGNMGLANAERTLYYLRVLTEFISQPEYRNLVPLFGIVNEALTGVIGTDVITSFYLRAYDVLRGVGGMGEGKGPVISIGDGFQALSSWKGFLNGSDRIAIEEHPYFSFGGPMLDPIAVLGPDGNPGGKWPKAACDNWGASTNQSRTDFGITFAGEFAASPNDCGLFLHGANVNSTDPDCPIYDDWQNYNDTMKQGVMNFVLAQMDAFDDWFFWTWKIGASQFSGQIETPLWSYQLGLRNGWMPPDPRVAFGRCAVLSPPPPGAPPAWNGTYAPWQTGSAPRNTFSIAASSSASFPWPPATISNAQVPVSLLPTYTDTAAIITLPVTVTGTGAMPSPTVSMPDGWFDKGDTRGGAVPIQGCVYPDEYFGVFVGGVIPTAPCTGPSSPGQNSCACCSSAGEEEGD